VLLRREWKTSTREGKINNGGGDSTFIEREEFQRSFEISEKRTDMLLLEERRFSAKKRRRKGNFKGDERFSILSISKRGKNPFHDRRKREMLNREKEKKGQRGGGGGGRVLEAWEEREKNAVLRLSSKTKKKTRKRQRKEKETGSANRADSAREKKRGGKDGFFWGRFRRMERENSLKDARNKS